MTGSSNSPYNMPDRPTTAPKHKVAVIQLWPKPMNPEYNFSRAATFIRQAAASGAQLAVLPEYHLTNWLPTDPKFLQICSQWQDYLSRYQALARELRISIVPGTIVQTRDTSNDAEAPNSGSTAAHVAQHDPSAPPASGRSEGHATAQHGDGQTGGPTAFNPRYTALENVAYFIGPDGAVLGSYNKKNLWGPAEREHLTSSGRDAHVAFDTPIGRVGMLVCWDLSFPEAFRELVRDGAKTIILPTFWRLSDISEPGMRHNPTGEALFVDSALVSRAFENTAAIVFANAGGPPGKGYAGLSQVVLPFVGPVARLGSCAEGMAIAEMDMQIVEDAEENYQIRADLQRDDWHYDYRGDEKRGSKL